MWFCCPFFLSISPPKASWKHTIGKVFGGQDAWLFVDFLVHCTPFLLYFSVSLSISILSKVHASVLFKVALIVSTIELTSFNSARGSLYEVHRYYISFDSAYDVLSDVNSKGDNGNDDDEGNNEKAECSWMFSRWIIDQVSRSTRTEEAVAQEMKWQRYCLAMT